MTALAVLALGNLCLSFVLAVLAHAVHQTGRYPAIAHGLWVLVLLKVLTPPLLTLPLLPAVGSSPLAAASVPPSGETPGGAASALETLLPVLLLTWAIGSALVLALSLLRVRRFDGLLRHTSHHAPAAIRAIAAASASRMGLRSCPAVLITSARISPLTWWLGGRIRIIIPAALCDELQADGLRWVLAHELAHVRRHDHLVRWLEWLACVAFWWNPVVWWARRSLRQAEEASCDALVLRRLEGRPQGYARALLAVVEFLAGQASRPPAVATGIDAGANLERRFRRIVGRDPRPRAPRRLSIAVMVMALSLMSLGIGTAGVPPSAGDPTEPSRTAPARLTAGVFAGEDDAMPSEHEPAGSADQAGYALLSAAVAPAAAVTRGTLGPDLLIGGRGADRLSGLAGSDRIAGRSGPDLLVGGKGADVLRGGYGADTILAGAGRDVVIGGQGADTVAAGRGDDLVRTWQDGSADHVDCGPGKGDRALVDALDVVVACEAVIVR